MIVLFIRCSNLKCYTIYKYIALFDVSWVTNKMLRVGGSGKKPCNSWKPKRMKLCLTAFFSKTSYSATNLHLANLLFNFNGSATPRSLYEEFQLLRKSGLLHFGPYILICRVITIGIWVPLELEVSLGFSRFPLAFLG